MSVSFPSALIGTRPVRRPASSTNLSDVASVLASRSFAVMPIRSATRAAGPRTSTGLPLDRSPAARSTTVGRKPARASQ